MTSLRARAFVKSGLRTPLELARAGEQAVTQILVRTALYLALVLPPIISSALFSICFVPHSSLKVDGMPFFEQAPLLLATKKTRRKSVDTVASAGTEKMMNITSLPLSGRAANDGDNMMHDATEEKVREPNVELDSSERSKVPAAECDRRVEACRSLARKIIRRCLD
jgi:hypothetical protein